MADAEEQNAKVLHCDNVWIDPPGRFEPRTVALLDGRISEVRNRGPASASPNAGCEIDLGSSFLLPGLINTHVHLEFSAGPNPLRDYLADTVSNRLSRAIRNSRSMLRSGVTTLRDCGSSLELLACVFRSQSDRILPRLLLSGPPITVSGGHLSIFGGEINGPEDIPETVSRSISGGAKSLKMIGSGGGMTPGSFPERVTFSQDVFCMIAETARKHDLASAAHVLSAESVKRAAMAGFDSLEHCAFFRRAGSGRLERRFEPEIAEIVADSGVSVMANLSTATRSHGTLAREGVQGNLDSQHALDQHEIMLENFRKMIDLGIPMVCGTDAGVRDTPFEDTWIELDLMARSGMSNVEVIRSASVNAARVLKLDGEVGRIAAGYTADFVVLKYSPLADISSYRDPLQVYCRGVRIRPCSSPEME